MENLPWLKLEEISWRRKARLKWLAKDDNNTTFFHKVANFRARNNEILRLQVRDTWLSTPNQVERVVTDFYKELISELFRFRPQMHGVSFQKVGEEWSL